jgi:hypothetical protein
MEATKNNSFTESEIECAPSESRALEPPTMPTVSLVIVTNTLETNATATVVRLSAAIRNS